MVAKRRRSQISCAIDLMSVDRQKLNSYNMLTMPLVTPAYYNYPEQAFNFLTQKGIVGVVWQVDQTRTLARSKKPLLAL